jgi:hypothetical protein
MKNEWIAATFGLPSLICKQHLGAQINKENQNKTVASYGDNVKSAAGVPGGSSMHVHQAIVNVIANDLRNGHIMFKTGIDALSGAVSGNMETKKTIDPEYSSRHDYQGTRRCNQQHHDRLQVPLLNKHFKPTRGS